MHHFLQNKREEYTPSKRYLNILIKGAVQLGLDNDYIQRLNSTTRYEASEKILQIRQSRPKPQDLPLISIQELAEHSSKNDTWVSILGFVIDMKDSFAWKRGRDLTTRYLMQIEDIAMDKNDDNGQPPYPLVKDIKDYQMEHLNNWFDSLHIRNLSTSDLRPIIGYLKEFKDQQDSGQTSFRLPK